MSLKFTAMGRLPMLSTLATPGRADDRAQDMDAASSTIEPPTRPRHLHSELPAALCILCLAASLAFLILNVSAP
jgi:hypothetical protein